MKFTLVTVCCAVVSLMLALHSPNALADGGDDAPAAEPSTAASPESLCRCVSERGPHVARIKAVLNDPLKESGLEFTEEPLENVVNFLQDEYGIPIQVDLPALEDASVTSDEPMSVNLRSVSLRSALRLMLKQKHLTYVVRHEVLLITTPEEVESDLTTCVYDVRDLVHANRADKDLKALTEAILSCVAYETWAAHKGGEAEIKPLRPGLLMISQTPEIHDEIHELLTAMRATLAQPAIAPSANASEAPNDDVFGDGGMGMEGEMGAGYGGEMGREPGGVADDPFKRDR